MSLLRILVVLVAPAAGLLIHADPVEVQKTGDASALTCQMKDSVTSLVLADDKVLDSEPTAEEKDNYNDALKEYKQKKQEYQLSEAKLMAAMENLLDVPAADIEYLEKAANGETGKDSLIVFYAPWCPHCQTFVLHDEKGNPLNAPYEIFAKDLAKSEDTKDVAVMRADIMKVRDGIPAKFVVEGIPSVYFISKAGKATMFKGNPHDTQQLKDFVIAHVVKASIHEAKQMVHEAKQMVK